MVTYSLQRVCGGRTATLVPQTMRRPYSFYANHMATLRVWVCCKAIASLAIFFTWHQFFSETVIPQRRNHTARSPYGVRTVALRWPWGGIPFLPCLGCLENRTAVSRRPCAGLVAPLRRSYGKLVAAATTVRSPYGHLPVTLQSPYGFWFHESYDRRAVAVAVVTATAVACKTLRF